MDCSASAGRFSGQAGDGIQAVKQEVRADAGLQGQITQSGHGLDIFPPLVLDIKITQYDGGNDGRDTQGTQQKQTMQVLLGGEALCFDI